MRFEEDSGTDVVKESSYLHTTSADRNARRSRSSSRMRPSTAMTLPGSSFPRRCAPSRLCASDGASGVMEEITRQRHDPAAFIGRRSCRWRHGRGHRARDRLAARAVHRKRGSSRCRVATRWRSTSVCAARGQSWYQPRPGQEMSWTSGGSRREHSSSAAAFERRSMLSPVKAGDRFRCSAWGMHRTVNGFEYGRTLVATLKFAACGCAARRRDARRLRLRTIRCERLWRSASRSVPEAVCCALGSRAIPSSRHCAS